MVELLDDIKDEHLYMADSFVHEHYLVNFALIESIAIYREIEPVLFYILLHFPIVCSHHRAKMSHS